VQINYCYYKQVFIKNIAILFITINNIKNTKKLGKVKGNYYNLRECFEIQGVSKV